MKFSYSYDHYYVWDEITALVEQYAQQYPQLCRLSSMAKTQENRDIWLLEVTNTATGSFEDKPGYCATANIHAGEVTGSMVVMAFMDYVFTNLDTDEVKEILDHYTLYFIPRISPDGSEYYLTTAGMCRSLNQMFPFNEIKEGIQEQDIDGDGKIHMMRVKSPCGAWKASTVDDRCMVRRRPDDTEGTFYNIYREGMIEIDPGTQLMAAPNKYGADFNRCFPCGWKPEGKQKGAGQYPLQNVETRNMAEFLKAHPNLVSLITFHTMGGVYLYPPASFHSKEAPAEDMNRYKKIAAMATEETGFPAVNICDGYIGSGMSSTINGSFSDYAFLGTGVMAMECECWDIDARVGSTLSFPPKPIEKTDTFTEQRALNVVRWLDENTGGEGYRRWEKFDHPQLGEVELGGLDFKFVIQNPPCKFLFEEVEKHVRFIRRHVKALPHLVFEKVDVQKIEGNTYKVTAQVTNTGYLPTYGTKMAETLKTAAPLTMTLSGDVEMVSGKPKQNIGHLIGYSGISTAYARAYIETTQHAPFTKAVSWIVSGAEGTKLTITCAAPKAGKVSAEVQL